MNTFSIYFNDLSIDTQQSIKDMVEVRIRQDEDKVKEIEQLAYKKSKGFGPDKQLEWQGIILEEMIEDEINRKFRGEGQV